MRAVRLGLSLFKSAGWRKATSLLALTAMVAAILTAYAAAQATEKSALGWYLETAYPDYELTPQPSLLGFTFGSPSTQDVSARTAQLISNATNVSKQLANVSDVVSAQPYVPLMLSTLQGTGLKNASVDSAAVFRAHEQNFVGRLDQGSAALGPRQILVPLSAASDLGLQAGMSAKLYTDFAFTAGPCMNVTCPAQPAEVNVTVAGVYEPTPGPPAGSEGIFPWAFSRLNAPVILNLSTLPSVLTNLTSLNVTVAQETLLNNAYTRYDVLVDRLALLDPLDTAGSTLRLARIRAHITPIAIEFGLQVSSQLEITYQHFLSDRGYVDLAILGFASPVAVIGAYSGALLGRTEALSRYRDFYIASARGASIRLLFESLGVEALLEASIAVCAAGAVVWIATQFAPHFLSLPVSAFGPGILPVAALLSVLVSFAGKSAAVARVLQARALGRLPRPRAAGLPTPPSTKVALELLAVGATLLAVTPFATATTVDTTVSGLILFGQQRDWFFAFASLAFVYAGALLLLRQRKRARPRKRLASESPATVYRNAASRSGKWPEPALLVVASLVVSIMIMMPGLVAVASRSQAIAVYGQTGSDILLVYPGSFPNQRPGSNNPPLRALANVSGVQSLTYSSSTRSASGLSLIMFDRQTYFMTIRPEMIEFGNELQATLSRSSQGAAAIANTAAAQSYGLTVGTAFGNLTVVGVLPKLPGIEDSSSISSPTLFIDYRTAGVNPNSTDITRVIVRLTNPDQAPAVQSNLLAVDPRALLEDAPGELQVLSHSPVFSSLSTTASVTLGALTAILLATLVGSLLASAAELQGDVARMRARGLTRRLGSRITGGLIFRGVLTSILVGVIMGGVSLLGLAWATGHLGALAGSLASFAILPMVAVLALYIGLAAVGVWILSRRLTNSRSAGLLRERVF